MASPEEQAKKMIANLPEKTGKTADEWIAIAKQSGLDKHRAILNHLKQEHGMTHGFANLIAGMTLKAGTADPQPADLVANQYSGAKANLRPIYDQLCAVIEQFGTDVELAPKKAYVSIRRNKQFAIIQPSTKTRVDVGLNLKGPEPTDRLEASGSFNSMVSHRVRITSPEQIDDELTEWLKQAYEQS